MNWIKNNWKPLALLGAGAVAMAVLVVVILARREDRGFMHKPCVKDQPAKGFTKWGVSDFPISVVLDPLAAEEWGGATLLAVRKWNDAVGKALLIEPIVGKEFDRSKCSEQGKPGDPVILITRINSDGSEEDGRAHAHPYWDAACRIRCVEVALPGLAPKGEWEQVATHELGHALGLDHDDFEQSVMYYGGKAMRWGMDEITEADKAMLRGSIQ